MVLWVWVRVLRTAESGHVYTSASLPPYICPDKTPNHGPRLTTNVPLPSSSLKTLLGLLHRTITLSHKILKFCTFQVLTCPTPPSCQTLQLICFISHSFKKCYVPGTAPVLQMLCRDLSLVAQLIEESSSN